MSINFGKTHSKTMHDQSLAAIMSPFQFFYLTFSEEGNNSIGSL